MGNVETKELICMIQGHELSWGGDMGEGGYRVEGNKEGVIGQL